MTKRNKPLTNEQRIDRMLKDMNSWETALLRERIQKISEITRNDIIKRKGDGYNTPFTTTDHWLSVCDKIDKHLNADH